MAGGSPRHNALCSSLIAALHMAHRNTDGRVFSSDQRIALGQGERYVYPDVTVVCGTLQIEGTSNDVIANPTVLVEVLSGSTEPYDRGLKWEGYQRIPSLADDVLVSQGEPRIEHYRRGSNGTWVYRAAGPGDRITLTDGAALDVDVIFQGVFDIPGD